jgi:transcriptional regulator with XRE-family HTH domain
MQWKREQAIALRKKGMTYQEIADSMGVSKAYVAVLLDKTVKTSNFHIWPIELSPYPVLTQWMNDNQMTRQELAEKLGYSPSTSSCYIITKIMKTDKFTKKEIDKLLELTGMTYEELFKKQPVSDAPYTQHEHKRYRVKAEAST